ncbi:formylmethanofuran dehydrogenase subunit C [Aureimonas fodinaquatilis]|uniref:Formylmethanofuran dehydrogenase subunit C n=1 Tax=Aureimonas fodinaquatilis TaxID=2565783 RepID=A0A5B0DPD0_9HYPH|nr:formylmethanofuran dehydrogenase subunit C [Aureimonas fodinaquatilis]KAA0968624.1 formylmethanofuran dehydrogenase subunit C [Aureimonas fodinaquatilis]
MSRLTLTLRGEPPERLDLSHFVPQNLAGLSESEIAHLPVGTTRRKLLAGDVFAIAMGDCEAMLLAGGSSLYDRVGEGMAAGTLHVEGDVGQLAGRRMTGGHLHIHGNAGPFAGSGMSDGLITIGGDAGDNLGGPMAGEMAGMTGGEISVGGNAGQRAGDRLRRGVISIAGVAGDYAGARMIAGTLVLAHAPGVGTGQLMKRGTIIVTQMHLALTATFVDNGPGEFLFLPMLAKSISGAWQFPMRMRRFSGDMAVLGKGEVLLPVE